MFLKALDGTNLDMEVLIAAHGNSLRALVKILDNVPEDYQKLKMWKSVGMAQIDAPTQFS